MSGTRELTVRAGGQAARVGTVRRTAFRVLSVLLALWVLLMGLFGLAEVVLMWLPARTVGDVLGAEAGGLDLAEHRSHFMAIGILAWAIVLPALAQLWRPERRVGSMLLLVVMAVASLVVFGLTGTATEWLVEEWSWVLPVLVLAVLHPGARDLVRVPALDPAQLALAGVALVPWAAYALVHLDRQVTGAGVEVTDEHWAIAALVGVVVVAGAAVGASHHAGWALPAWISAGASTLFGVHSLAFPDATSALPAGWAVAAVLWGVGYAAATLTRRRRSLAEAARPATRSA